MAKLTYLRPMLWVDDVKATINWYVATLGFEESAYEEPLQWGEVKRDEVYIMLAKPNAHAAYSGASFTGSLYITTDDVDSIWALVKDGPNVFYGLENFDYGMREFAVKDCNGYILQFGQELLNEEDRTLPA